MCILELLTSEFIVCEVSGASILACTQVYCHQLPYVLVNSHLSGLSLKARQECYCSQWFNPRSASKNFMNEECWVWFSLNALSLCFSPALDLESPDRWHTTELCNLRTNPSTRINLFFSKHRYHPTNTPDQFLAQFLAHDGPTIMALRLQRTVAIRSASWENTLHSSVAIMTGLPEPSDHPWGHIHWRAVRAVGGGTRLSSSFQPLWRSPCIFWHDQCRYLGNSFGGIPGDDGLCPSLKSLVIWFRPSIWEAWAFVILSLEEEKHRTL